MTKKTLVIICILLTIFNLIALYVLNFKIEDCIGAQDILIEYLIPL